MSGDTDDDDGTSAVSSESETDEGSGRELGFDHPATVSVDERVGLTITNLSVETVAVRVTLADQRGRDWEASVSYDTPDETLDIGTATSSEGEVTEGVTDLVQRATPASDSGPYEPDETGDELTVHVEHDGATLGSTTIERTFGNRDVTSDAVDGESFAGRIYEPSGSESAPAVVVLHGSDGARPDGTARLLAGHGFVALAVQYFDWQGRHDSLPTELVSVPVESVENAVERVLERDRVRGPDVGLVGRSKGGELALLAGSRLDSVGPVVSINGSGVVWPGIDWQTESPGSSWTAAGDPVPYVPYTDDKSVWDLQPPMEMEPVYSQSLDEADAETIAEATIAVESVTGPVLLVSGGTDGMWDSVRLHGMAADRLDSHGRDYEHLVYPDAGHAITTPYVPSANRARAGQFVMGGSADGYAEADRDHWQHVIETFETLRT